MKTVIIWALAFYVSDGKGGWQLGHFQDGTSMGTLGKLFSPVAGWQCDYEEAKRPDGTVYRYVACLKDGKDSGAQLEVEICNPSSPTHFSHMKLLDFAPGGARGSNGEVAIINLGCVTRQP
jgi:hypothetical protein